jgi:hypothetical protein
MYDTSESIYSSSCEIPEDSRTTGLWGCAEFLEILIRWTVVPAVALLRSKQITLTSLTLYIDRPTHEIHQQYNDPSASCEYSEFLVDVKTDRPLRCARIVLYTAVYTAVAVRIVIYSYYLRLFKVTTNRIKVYQTYICEQHDI